MSRTSPEPRRALPCFAAARVCRHDGGFTLISAVFVLVVLAALGTAMMGITQRQQLGSAAELDSARALQSARGGLEWAAFQVLQNPAPPAAAPACFGSTNMVLAPFTVTVSCTRTPGSGTLSDGATALVFYELVATACNAPVAGACPTTGTPGTTYVERQLSWTVVR
jgi:MSHA biogenesis protein MshP